MAAPETKTAFPGELATSLQVFHLAESYRRAADRLATRGRSGDPLSQAPYRLAAIQAIELYLNALLLQHGYDARRIKGMQHDLGARTQLAIAGGLKLRDRTAKHLESMVTNREYVVTRYSPEMISKVSQINRLTATLNEVAKKVRVVLEGH